MLCPDTPQFPIESKEAEIHTKKLKYVHNNTTLGAVHILRQQL